LGPQYEWQIRKVYKSKVRKRICNIFTKARARDFHLLEQVRKLGVDVWVIEIPKTLKKNHLEIKLIGLLLEVKHCTRLAVNCTWT